MRNKRKGYQTTYNVELRIWNVELVALRAMKSYSMKNSMTNDKEAGTKK